ncbi:family 43 glycosylhydrolase [Bacillus sonorensis]|nr:family 43 glycosylhydrolase [Bacillus sonorensis]
MKSGDVTEPASQTSDDFTSENLSLQWQWQANPKEEWYSLQARPGHLRLYSRHSPDRFKLGGMPNLVMQKFPGPGFTATVKLTLYALSETIRAGLAVMGKEYAYLGLSKSENEGHVIAFYKGSIEEAGNEDIKTEEHPVSDGMVYLRVQVDEKAVCRFSYSQDHHHFTAMGDVFQAVPGIWIGAKVGMYCADAGTDGPDGSYCDFDWFIVSQEGMAALTKKTYANPVLTGFHPDPSIIRVDEDYYMVNSTFQYFPAIVISHSKDLVNWKIIGHGITENDGLDLSGIKDSHGIWAPDISYHDGMFYIFATHRLNGPTVINGKKLIRRQIMMKSNRPEGPYSKPVFIDEGSGIDPSHFVDDDGRHYMLLSPGCTLFPLNDECTEIIGE